MNVHIPTPCHESLSDMKPVKAGFYCSSCAHDVVDFREMSELEIQLYFKNKTTKTCGIFHEEQVTKHLKNRTDVYNFSGLTLVQKFACALLICFSSLFVGCSEIPFFNSTHALGKVAVIKGEIAPPDTTEPTPILGMIAIPDDSTSVAPADTAKIIKGKIKPTDKNCKK